jgi:hypothetical protein
VVNYSTTKSVPPLSIGEPVFKQMEVGPFVELLKEYVKAIYHLYSQSLIDNIVIKISVVNNLSEDRPI